MISHKHECIFVHVPKCAGTSILKIFLDLHGLKWKDRAPLLLGHNPDPTKGPERLAHLTAAQYISFGYVDRDTFQRYFKFSFVRNPWDRLVSEYRYLQLEGGMPFRQFVEESFLKVDDYSNASQHIMPQSAYVSDLTGEYLVDFIGRFESLDADFAYVAERLNLPVATLPHRNVSGEGKFAKLYRKISGRKLKREKKRPYQDYYSDGELRERVDRFYAEDIERFGYRFDGSFASGPIL